MRFNASLFWRKVNKTDTCWLWQGYINSEGYGEYRSKVLRTRLAHRIAYALDGDGTVPDMPLDHLCRNRHCVNPDHLEPVSVKVNTRRSNHEYTEENTLTYGGKRRCRTCKNERARESRKR